MHSNFLIQAEKMARVHSCTVEGDPKCLRCVIEAFRQPGGCPGGAHTQRKFAAAVKADQN